MKPEDLPMLAPPALPALEIHLSSGTGEGPALLAAFAPCASRPVRALVVAVDACEPW